MVVGEVAIQRNFHVAVGRDKAWQRLAEVERWPEWAPHIISVEVSPRGPLGPSSSGSLHIRKFGRNKFHMSTWDPMNHWEWRGGLPGVRINYDHQFKALSDNSTQMTWVVTIRGSLAWLIRPIFRRNYGRAVDLAIPRLKEWIRA